jgi:hypothetical protein
MNVSWLAVLLAAVAAFAIGALWYSPLLFARAWQREAGLAWVAAGVGVLYLFERRSLRLLLINGGYLTLAFTAIGLVIALAS